MARKRKKLDTSQIDDSKKPSKKDNIHHESLLHILSTLGHPLVLSDLLVEEHRFHPERRWRFDIALVNQKIAFEVEGGIWVGGRHIHPSGFEKDCEKYNTAAAMGWKVLRLHPKIITKEYVKELLDLIAETSS